MLFCVIKSKYPLSACSQKLDLDTQIQWMACPAEPVSASLRPHTKPSWNGGKDVGARQLSSAVCGVEWGVWLTSDGGGGGGGGIIWVEETIEDTKHR